MVPSVTILVSIINISKYNSRRFKERFKDSKIQRFKNSKIQRFKDSKIQRFFFINKMKEGRFFSYFKNKIYIILILIILYIYFFF